MTFYCLLWNWLNLLNLVDFVFDFLFEFDFLFSFFTCPSILAIFIRSNCCLIRCLMTIDSIFARFGSLWWKTPNRCQYNHGSELIKSGNLSFFSECAKPISKNDIIIDDCILGSVFCTISESFWGPFIGWVLQKSDIFYNACDNYSKFSKIIRIYMRTQ